jgi:hypothetical protein
MSDTAQPRIVVRRLFTDGVERDVYEDADGRQWVAGHNGEPVYGVWVPPADEPWIVSGGRLCPDTTSSATSRRTSPW